MLAKPSLIVYCLFFVSTFQSAQAGLSDNIIFYGEWLDPEKAPTSSSIDLRFSIYRGGKDSLVWTSTRNCAVRSRAHWGTTFVHSFAYNKASDSSALPAQMQSNDTLYVYEGNTLVTKSDLRHFSRLVSHLAVQPRYEYAFGNLGYDLDGFSLEVQFFEQPFFAERVGTATSPGAIAWTEESSGPRLSSALAITHLRSTKQNITGLSAKIGFDIPPFSNLRWLRLSEQFGAGWYSRHSSSAYTNTSLGLILDIGIGIRLHETVELRCATSHTFLSGEYVFPPLTLISASAGLLWIL